MLSVSGISSYFIIGNTQLPIKHFSIENHYKEILFCIHILGWSAWNGCWLLRMCVSTVCVHYYSLLCVQYGLPYLAFRSCHFNKVYSEFDLLSVITQYIVSPWRRHTFMESKLIVKFPYTSSASLPISFCPECGLALFSTASLPPKPNSCGVYDAGSLKTDQRQVRRPGHSHIYQRQATGSDSIGCWNKR